MFSKSQFLDFVLILILSMAIFLIGIGREDMGLWEPWETSTILAAQEMAQSSIVESSFWVPRVEGTFVMQPYLQLWSLTTILQAFSTLDRFMLRLPGAILGIILVLLSFFTVRQISTRRTAWMCAGILLTIPMFVLSGRFVHGDIWLMFAVTLPNLLFAMACYASTRRMHRVMLSLSSLSAGLSFLAGGLFALAILLAEGLLLAFLLRKNPQKSEIFRPMTTRYFLVPLYLSFVFVAGIFGIYVTQARYELEGRTPMTLEQVNRALDEDRVITIERRQKQIIGTMRTIGSQDGHQAFILVESNENLNTNATDIFSRNVSEQRAFENSLMWRFQKKAPSRAAETYPPIDDAFQTALKFFWYHTNNAIAQPKMTLARVNAEALAQNPQYAQMRTESVIQNPDAPAYEYALVYAENALRVPVKISENELLRVINQPEGFDWIEVQNGADQRGFVHKSVLSLIENRSTVNWTSWLKILLYGLFPWSCFFPIVFVCASISPKHLAIAGTPFRGEFNFTVAEEALNQRAPIQSVLLSWVIVAIVALFFGINHNRHDFYVGIIPVAILLSLSLTAPRFWRALRESLEARFALIVAAILAMFFVVYALPDEPFRLVRYMMTDPTMHWDSQNAAVFKDNVGLIVGYILCFIVLTIVALGGASERIQEGILVLREKWEKLKPAAPEPRMPSYSSLLRISRGETEPIPYAPAISLILLGAMSALFIYFNYMPAISDDFTEKDLISRYFELAKSSEPIYLVTGENTQLCQSYRDCEPGYICQNSRCQITTFASYSLSVTHPISRSEMIASLDPASASNPAFYVVPKDTIYSINQSYRALFSPESRHNLKVIDAASSRLYLIGNRDKEAKDINPMNDLLPAKIPDDASRLDIDLDEDIAIEGFRMDRFDLKRDHAIELTLYFRVKKIPDPNRHFVFSFDVANRNVTMQRPLLDRRYEIQKLIVGDLVASKLSFELTAMPPHGNVEVRFGSSRDGQATPLHALTTVGF